MSPFDRVSGKPEHHRRIAALFLLTFIAWVGRFFELDWMRPG